METAGQDAEGGEGAASVGPGGVSFKADLHQHTFTFLQKKENSIHITGLIGNREHFTSL